MNDRISERIHRRAARRAQNLCAPGAEHIENIIRNLESPQGFSPALSALQEFDLESVSEDKRLKLINAIRIASTMRGGPLLVLSLPQSIQAEISLFSTVKVLGIDRMALKRATPSQIVRYLTTNSTNKRVCDTIISNYNFSAFKKDHWLVYFSRCSAPIAAAKTFLLKNEELGGFSDGEITQLVLRNPVLIEYMPVSRLGPNTVVALLISGRVSTLWQKYDFTRLEKNHWRELFLHTNPDRLPEASRPFVENKDGKGFTDEELLAMAQKCHALINFLNPNKVPFNVVYELSLTGRADLLWRNYPFASLDKAEWRMVLTNPAMWIPDYFLNVVKNGRFTIEDLCNMSIRNDRLFPVLLKLDITTDKIIKILLSCDADYVWANYHFSRFSAADWTRLILGLKDDVILKPRAMMTLKTCRELTEAQVRRILSKNPTYAPNVPISTIAPDVAVDLLIRGKCYFLWDAYDFKRLDDDLWLRLLENTKGVLPKLGEDFLRYRAGTVDNARLNVVLSRRWELIEFVDAKYIAPELAVSVLMDKTCHKLWDRFDFMRLDAKQLTRVISAHEYISDTFPKSLQACFKQEGKPFRFQDLLELAAINPCVVVDNIATEWVESLDDRSFEKLVSLSVSNDSGAVSLRKRLNQDEKPWNTLPRCKLKRLLTLAPELRFSVGWDNWTFSDIAELAKTNTAFERGIAHPVRYFFWKHFKSLFAMGALTTAAIVAICLHNRELDRQETRRQYLNSIVQSVKQFDQKRSYLKLNEFWKTIEPNDQALVKDDLFVKRAFENLTAWEADCKVIESGMSHLREMSKVGWGMVAKDAVEAVIVELEKHHVDRYAGCSEFQSLKNAHSEYRKQEAERARIKTLRDELVEINGRFSECDSLAQLAEWKVLLNSLAREKELKDEATQVLEKVIQRIDVIRIRVNAERIAKISNVVASVSEELKKPTALQDFLTWSSEYHWINRMSGFDEYVKQSCYSNYVCLSEDVMTFEKLKKGEEDKFAEAKLLDEKFSKEFVTIEGGTMCSNIISYCEASLKISKSKGWPALSDANEKIKKLIEKIYARNLRCWTLVDKINTATDYAGYLTAKKLLIKEFGHFDQLKHLGIFKDIDPEDLNQSYTSDSNSTWWGKQTYKYHFVGMIWLQPGAPSSTKVYVLPGKTTTRAELYALWKSASGSVSFMKLLVKKSDEYYKISGVDYSNCQGVPLFVRSEHYAGKED